MQDPVPAIRLKYCLLDVKHQYTNQFTTVLFLNLANPKHKVY